MKCDIKEYLEYNILRSSLKLSKALNTYNLHTFDE